jgi:hypothetical protein
MQTVFIYESFSCRIHNTYMFGVPTILIVGFCRLPRILLVVKTVCEAVLSGWLHGRLGFYRTLAPLSMKNAREDFPSSRLDFSEGTVVRKTDYAQLLFSDN